MCISNDPLDIIKWATRLLWLELFIACIVCMGYWHLPFTLWFFMGNMALLLPQIFYKEEILDQTNQSKMVESRRPIIDFSVCETNQNNSHALDLYLGNPSKKPSCSTHDTLAKSEGCSQGFLGCGLRLSKMETQTTFDELQQAIVDNIATQAFLRGKIDGLRNLADYFTTFNAKNISVEDLQKSIEGSILLLQEALK